MPSKNPIIYWLRQDLRLADNQALLHAASLGPVVPVFIWDKDAAYNPGGASRWWLHQALIDLADSFKKYDVPLILRQGDPEQVLLAIAKESGAKNIVWCRGYEPGLRESDARIMAVLDKAGVTVDIRNGFLLHEPESIKNGSGNPYRVYTPFSKACRASGPVPAPLPAPKKLENVKGIKSDKLEDWKLVPRTAVWPKGLAQAWQVGEKAGHMQLKNFVAETLGDYKVGRNHPDKDHTSRLSPYLHFGHISPRQAWHAIEKAQHQGDGVISGSAERYLLELLWREFAWHLIFHFPDMDRRPLNPAFANFPWHSDATALKAWQRGMTGYPIVDAGMRQLWQTGWMHNRVRMIVASFLIKHLLIDWRTGMDWFWDTLVDADFANNSVSWQWVAGCGADAAPYFRIFNPILQGKKFDVKGDYVRKFVPELAGLSPEYIHEPWTAPADMLKKANIKLGQTYPEPIVEHNKARKRALTALKEMRQNTDEPLQTELFS